MKSIWPMVLCAVFCAQTSFAQSTEEPSGCDALVALFIELGERSGETVSEAEARAEVLSENPTEAECLAMLALFEAQK